MLDAKVHNKWIIALLVLMLIGWFLFSESLTSNSDDKSSKTPQVIEAVISQNLASDMTNASESAKSIPGNSNDSPENKNLLKSIESGLKPVKELEPRRAPENTKRSEERKARLEKFKVLTQAAKEKDWDNFLELSEEVMAQSEYSKHSTLVAAIRDKAPKRVFERLRSRGAQFQPHHLMRVVMMDDLNFLKMLVSLGLDIHMTGRNGENGINSLVNSLASKENFNFLLVNNVEIKTGKDGTSPLTTALNRAIRSKDAVYYAYRLVQHGIPIGEADIELVKRLSKENKQSYDLIKSNLPELIGNQ